MSYTEEFTNESLKVNDQVLNCLVVDETGLNDFQKLPAQDEIAIPKVGINRFRAPLMFDYLGEKRFQDCEISMQVNLRAGKTGINMSRLCQIINEVSEKSPINFETTTYLLQSMRTRLLDRSEETPLDAVYLQIETSLPLKQKSLRSDNWGWQYYDSVIESSCTDGEMEHFLTVHYEYSSTCPCSLSMAKQYEKDYAAGKVTEGTGVATAHSQRSGAKVKVKLSSQGLEHQFFVPQLVELLRLALPTETQSLVKRTDEQAFAILNGSNPMFVEHASKRLHRVLNSTDMLSDWVCEIEHWESLHSHNAIATIYKGIEQGLKKVN